MRTNNSNTGGKEEICLNLSALSFFFLLSSFPLSLHASAVSLCLSLSVHQPFLTIKNLSSHFPSNSPALSRSLHFCYSLLYHRSLSINLTGSLACLYLGLIFFSLHFVCQRLKQKEPHVFFVFYFSLRHQNHIQKNTQIYICQEKKKKHSYSHSKKKSQCSSCHLWSCTDCCWQVKPQWQKSQLSICDKTDNHWFTEINIAVVTSSVQYVLMGNVGTNGEAVWRVGCTDC